MPAGRSHGVIDVATRGSSHEALAGVVERVTFHNEETGFCVLRVKARGGTSSRWSATPRRVTV